MTLPLLSGFIGQSPCRGGNAPTRTAPASAPSLPLRIRQTKARYLFPFSSFFKFGQFLNLKTDGKKKHGHHLRADLKV